MPDIDNAKLLVILRKQQRGEYITTKSFRKYIVAAGIMIAVVFLYACIGHTGEFCADTYDKYECLSDRG